MSLPSGRYRIVHQASSNLVTLPNGRKNTGIVLTPYNNSTTQTWDITAVGTDEEYTIKSVAFPSVFAAHAGISEGAALGSSMTSISWVLTTKDDAYYTILAVGGGHKWYGTDTSQLTIWSASHAVDDRYRFQFVPV